MPVRSSSSRVLRWPNAATVDQAVRAWARGLAAEHTEILKVGYYGSYARGDWGVGSDVDLLVILSDSAEPFERRGIQLGPSGLPVPSDLLMYTTDEWARLETESSFGRTVAGEVTWVFERDQ